VSCWERLDVHHAMLHPLDSHVRRSGTVACRHCRHCHLPPVAYTWRSGGHRFDDHLCNKLRTCFSTTTPDTSSDWHAGSEGPRCRHCRHLSTFVDFCRLCRLPIVARHSNCERRFNDLLCETDLRNCFHGQARWSSKRGDKVDRGDKGDKSRQMGTQATVARR